MKENVKKNNNNKMLEGATSFTRSKSVQGWISGNRTIYNTERAIETEKDRKRGECKGKKEINKNQNNEQRHRTK